MRDHVPRAAVSAGDDFFALLDAALAADERRGVQPRLAALQPLSERAMADHIVCHAHAYAEHHVDNAEPGALQCAACHKPIHDSAIETMDQYWHQQCFACAVCRQNLATAQFFVNDKQQIVCETHY